MSNWHPTKWRFRHKNAQGEVLWESDWFENALADEGEQDILEVYFVQSKDHPTTFYIGLVDDTPVETDGLGDLLNEPSGNGYARQSVTFATATLVSGDYETQSATVTFTASGGSIGPVTYAFLTDVETGTTGLLIAYVALSQSRTLSDGDSLEVDITASLS